MNYFIILQEPPIYIDENLANLIIAILGGIFTIAGALITAYYKDNKWKKSYRPKAIKAGEQKNTVLLIGIGRSGKSQLLNSLTDYNPKLRRIITQEFSIYTKEDHFKHKLIKYFFTDYRGQNFAQLISNFISEQLKPDTPIRYGDINSLVVVVDLFPEEDNRKDISKQYSDVNIERINQQLTNWNSVALDAVFGLLTKEALQFVGLFVNKIDKLEYNLSEEKKQKIVILYEPLIHDLETRAENSDANYKTIFGSAAIGSYLTGPESLMYYLTQNSVPKKSE